MRKVTQVVGATAGALLFLGLGAGIGGAGQRTVTVEKTPASCIEVLGMFEQTAGIGSKQMTLAAEAIQAVRYRNTATIDTITVKVNALTKELEDMSSRLETPVRECRSK
ncbi:hypothetical protein BJG92_03557 [Arthrobacter sp. SO5]|uniref:hypothetical protein n=1 Tax=Arthrobacter sp. SO5 TaxID=1897055 RepID=UPI001E48461B|nr:hypothetical protein [Arthrobacter sp. SO5]MCB5276002.1 hypothetical protein [Arthrobacter sp. SO5]